MARITITVMKMFNNIETNAKALAQLSKLSTIGKNAALLTSLLKGNKTAFTIGLVHDHPLLAVVASKYAQGAKPLVQLAQGDALAHLSQCYTSLAKKGALSPKQKSWLVSSKLLLVQASILWQVEVNGLPTTDTAYQGLIDALKAFEQEQEAKRLLAATNKAKEQEAALASAKTLATRQAIDSLTIEGLQALLVERLEAEQEKEAEKVAAAQAKEAATLAATLETERQRGLSKPREGKQVIDTTLSPLPPVTEEQEAA